MLRSPIRQLYEKLLQSSEIPIIERADIFSKGLYLSEDGKKEIYIKQSLIQREKLKVLLHEYSHHIHLTYHFKQESRAECEIIAKGSAYFICLEFGLKVCKEVYLSKFSYDVDVVKRVKCTIQSVAIRILNGLRGDEDTVSVYEGRYFMEDCEATLRDYEKHNLGKRSFKVTITETLKLTTCVEAKDQQEAEEMVSDNWKRSEYVLDADNFHGVEFTAVMADKQEENYDAT